MFLAFAGTLVAVLATTACGTSRARPAPNVANLQRGHTAVSAFWGLLGLALLRSSRDESTLTPRTET